MEKFLENIRITDYLDKTAARLPDKVAYLDSKREITFAQMKDEAYRIAAALADAGKFKQPVGIFLEQCVEVVPSIMGVAYSGNFYSILDVDMPEARIDKILETFEPVAIITDEKHKARATEIVAASSTPDAIVLVYEEMQQTELTSEVIQTVDDTKNKVITTDLLYVLFTSGSTGVPKGVVHSHKSVMSEVDWLPTAVQIDDTTVFCNQAPFYFVMSTLEVFQTVKCGCTTCIPPRIAFAFPGMLLEYLVEHQVNTLYWVPTMLVMFANMGVLEEKVLPPIRLVMPSGEVMPMKQLNMWIKAFPEAVFVNQYGPTEMADIVAYYIVDREFKETESLPIGKVAEHMSCLILNDKDEEVAPGEEGEFCGRGPSLAYGYYRNPEKTAEAFVQNPLVDGYEEKIYRSGDLVKMNERGELIYVTRKDFQIKHMGHRIELGEIETAASSLEGMDRPACVYDDEAKEIVMFYVGTIEPEAVRNGVKNIVPDYMVPNKVHKIDVMPTNLNGKIDRKELKSRLKFLYYSPNSKRDDSVS